MTWQFETCCVNSDGPSITAMVDNARDITRRTFLRHVDRDNLASVEASLKYDTGTERGGLRMSKDYHVSYHRSTYRGRPCVYFRHSAIEYIFTAEGGAS
jgi:hypothetical protein